VECPEGYFYMYVKCVKYRIAAGALDFATATTSCCPDVPYYPQESQEQNIVFRAALKKKVRNSYLTDDTCEVYM